MEFKNLSERMLYYRSISDYKLLPKTYVIAMLDGRKFSSYTKDLKKPFDSGFIDDMNETAKYLCENISGCKFAFVQSDEISLFISDFENTKTQAWFDYRLNKLLSLSASMATSKFNQLRLLRAMKDMQSIGDIKQSMYEEVLNQNLGEFDAKFWNVSSQNDVYAWFLFRQNDCLRNSISMVAQTYFSTKELNKKNKNEMQEMLFQKCQINWNDFPIGQKRGRLIRKNKTITEINNLNVERKTWVIEDAPMFNGIEGREFLLNLIPLNEQTFTMENTLND